MLTTFRPEDSGCEALYSFMNSRLEHHTQRHVSVTRGSKANITKHGKLENIKLKRKFICYLKCTQEQAGRGVPPCFFFFFLLLPSRSKPDMSFRFTTMESLSLGTYLNAATYTYGIRLKTPPENYIHEQNDCYCTINNKRPKKKKKKL
ncbi:hypothetical protein HanRHA438_Chr00c17g0851481 [Helianthus annuus]|nr:hypothetical protein HanRHA438_Chr00c17g0851481 [Helianthus annuus]